MLLLDLDLSDCDPDPNQEELKHTFCPPGAYEQGSVPSRLPV